MFTTLCLVSLTVAAAAEKSPFEVGKYTGHSGPVTSVVFAPAGEVVSASEDGTVRRWDSKTLQVRGEQPIKPFKKPTQVAIAPQGELIAVAGNEGSFYFGARDFPASVYNHLDEESELSSVAFSPDGKWLAVGGTGSLVTIWDVSKSLDGKTFRTSFNDKKLDLPPNCIAEHLVFAPDSKVLMTLGQPGPEFKMQMWDAQTGKMLGERPADGPALAFSPDSKTAITGRTIWKIAQGQPPVRLESFHPLNAAVYSPDSKWVVTGGHDNRITFWDVPTGKPVAIVRAHDNAVTSVALSQDGKLLVSGSQDGTARLWDVNKILSEKPLEQPLSKLAKSPKAHDAWRLGFCYTKGIVAYDPKQAKLATLDEAEKRAAALGVKLPPLPDNTDLGEKMKFLAAQQEQLARQVSDKYGKTVGKVFMAGLTLPMLQLALEYEVQSVAEFGEKILPGLEMEMVNEFGALPVMFNRLQEVAAIDEFPEDTADQFDNLMREVNVHLQAFASLQQPAEE